jgi:hypothetical protein
MNNFVCYRCNSETITGFTIVTARDMFVGKDRDTGIKVYLCKQCIDKMVKLMSSGNLKDRIINNE